MGLSITAAGAVVLLVMLVVFSALCLATLQALSIHVDALSVKSELEKSALTTAFRIDGASLSGKLLAFNLTNIGEGKLWRYPLCDVIVSYTVPNGNATLWFCEKLNYSSTLAPGCWSIQTIYNDLRDPGILNYEETAAIVAFLSRTPLQNSPITIVFSSDLGVTASYSFTPSR